MSFIASTPETICNSPMNLSKSKMLYSIPKAPRMGIEAKQSCSQAFYELPGVRESRATSFGYGTKSDFTKYSEVNPAPNAYSTRSDFAGGHKRGYSFGVSRDLMPISGNATVGDKTSPGPGNYDTRETLKTNISYSMRKRTGSLDPENTSKLAPGPGAYEAVDVLSPKGKLFIAKYKSAVTQVISPARSRRFKVPADIQRPGPGAYEIGGQMNTSGSYFVSKLRSNIGKSFGLSLKGHSSAELFKDSNPGPGAYESSSEFGHYGAKVVQNTVA